MTLTERLHGRYVYQRRVRVISDHLAELLPQHARVLDVGCGDGQLAWSLAQKRPDIRIRGIDVLARDQTCIPVGGFGGKRIPFCNASFDVVMFVDVLHHMEDPMILLRQAVRVASRGIVIKDHTLNGFLARRILKFMDRVGNARYGVALPYNYWSQQRWFETFAELCLTLTVWRDDLRLYPQPVDWVFGRSLHFIARLELESPLPRAHEDEDTLV